MALSLLAVLQVDLAAAQTPAPPRDPPPASPPPQDPSPPASADAESPDEREHEAWILYDRAFSAARKGDIQAAQRLLASLRERFPDHPASARARTLLELLDARSTTSQPRPPRESTRPDRPDEPDRDELDRDEPDERVEPRSREAPSKAALAELAVMQTLHGIGTGIEFCLVVDCNSDRSILGMPLLGGAAGLTLSLFLVPDATDGQRGSINAGTLWGLFNGIMVGMITELDEKDRNAYVLILSQMVGTIGGGILAHEHVFSGDQVATANTVGMWSGVLAGLAMDTFDVSLASDSGATTLLLSADLGLIAGGVLAHRYPWVSRGRTLLIDAGGIVGIATGLGMATLVGGEDASGRTTTASMLVGALAGLGVTAYFTRGWDTRKSRDPLRGARFMLTPRRQGGWSASMGWNF